MGSGGGGLSGKVLRGSRPREKQTVTTEPYIWCEHVFDTIDGPVKSDAPYQVDEEDHVWKYGGEVHHLQKEPESKVSCRIH